MNTRRGSFQFSSVRSFGCGCELSEPAFKPARTTKPSTCSFCHMPLLFVTCIVKSRTSSTLCSVTYGVSMKPNAFANALTSGGERVSRVGWLTTRPCRCSPDFSAAYGRICSSNESSQSYQCKYFDVLIRSPLPQPLWLAPTSATQVRRSFHSLAARSCRVLPEFFKPVFNHSSPTSACERAPGSLAWPMACLDVTRSSLGDSAATRMRHPFDLRVK